MGCFHIKTKRHHYQLHMWFYHGTYAYMALRREYNDQKQSFANVLQNSYSQKFSKFRMKTPVLESLFNKFLHRCFPEASLKSFANSTGLFSISGLFRLFFFITFFYSFQNYLQQKKHILQTIIYKQKITKQTNKQTIPSTTHFTRPSGY